jgi:hypothetical protein
VEELHSASGELKTYNADGSLNGSCTFTANNLTNEHILFGYVTTYYNFEYSDTYVSCSDPSPPQFGPGCTAPKRGDVFPPTVRGQVDGTLVWSRSWWLLPRYGLGPTAPREPWAVGDHTRTVFGTPENGITSDVWTNLHTEAPLERHFAP